MKLLQDSKSMSEMDERSLLLIMVPASSRTVAC